MTEQPNLLLILQGVFWLVLIFVIGRWLVLWYFKINHRAALQERTVALLESINLRLGGENIILPEQTLRVPSIPRSVMAFREKYFAVKEFPKGDAGIEQKGNTRDVG